MAIPKSFLNIRERCENCVGEAGGCTVMVPLPGMPTGKQYFFCKLPKPAARQLTMADIERAREESIYPLDRKLKQAAAEGRTSFLSHRLTDQIREWCRTDARVDSFWSELTNRVHRGLNDEIVNGIFQCLGRLLGEWNQERAALERRNRDNIRTIVSAAREVIEAYDGAESRGEVEYMEAAVEELDAAIEEITQHPGM